MYFKKHLFTFLSAACLFFSCEEMSNYRFAEIDAADEKGVDGSKGIDLSGYPADGSLAFHEDFRSWRREGYVNLVAGSDCEGEQMTTSVIMYVPDRPVKATYNGFSIAYTLQDFAVSPTCGNTAGSSTPLSDVSTGYVALQQLVFYECGQHTSNAFMQLSPLPSVAKIQFSVSLGGRTDDVKGKGVTLWKKAGGTASFSKVGDYQPANETVGEVFSVDINEKDVQLKFTPAITNPEKDSPVNDGINRAVRIHDLWVWSMITPIANITPPP